MATRQARSFCRICAAHCGVVLTIENETDLAVLSRLTRQTLERKLGLERARQRKAGGVPLA